MESRTRFLSLVPLVHSRVRGHTIRGIRSKDIHSIKQLNVPLYRHTDKSVYVKDGLMVGPLVGEYLCQVVLFTVLV